jgi:hypothetical protein
MGTNRQGETGGQQGWQGAKEVGPSERVVRLFMTQVTLNQTLENWYHFIRPIRHIKNLLTVK